VHICNISIPYGAIKSWGSEWDLELLEEISIPYGAIKSNTNIISIDDTSKISIPYGAIKSLLMFILRLER